MEPIVKSGRIFSGRNRGNWRKNMIWGEKVIWHFAQGV